MLSASDLPACPACGSHAVHCILNPGRPRPKLYACMKCGRDQTDAWAAVQPARKPEPEPILPPDSLPLGICAELKT